jgi:hypothetical protein
MVIEARKRDGHASEALRNAAEHNLGRRGYHSSTFSGDRDGTTIETRRSPQPIERMSKAKPQTEFPPAEPIHHVIPRARQALLRGRASASPYGKLYGPAPSSSPAPVDLHIHAPRFQAPPIDQNSSWRAPAASSQVAMNQKTGIHEIRRTRRVGLADVKPVSILICSRTPWVRLGDCLMATDRGRSLRGLAGLW